jgi:uncharacterized protein
MGERTSHPPGTFSWADLATTDVEGAKAFYHRLFGWEAEDHDAGNAGTYTTFLLDGREAAGAFPQRAEQRERDWPATWISHVTVADVDAAAARVPGLGGTVHAGPFDIPEAGRMAVVADPTGGALALWQPRRHHGAAVVNEPGALTWNDLWTPDPAAAARFYGELLGWEIAPIPGAPYWTIANGGRRNGGLLEQPQALRDAGVPAAWNAYVAVADLDAALATATEAGGELAFGPMEVPAGRFAAVRDPQGAVVSLSEAPMDD